MPDYRHRKKRVKKEKNDQNPSGMKNPIVNYDTINIEVGKIMKEKEKERKERLKNIRKQNKRRENV